jgi:hypothetical protein
MPIDRLPGGIAVTHPFFSYHANAENLPQLSNEMFWWLKSHHDLGQNPSDKYLKKNIFENITDTALRCSYAACRIYVPKLSEPGRTLTPYGSEIASKVNDVIEASRKEPNEYHSVCESDKNFINAFMTWRAIGLLVTMDLAIEVARERRMKHLEKTNSLPPNPPISILTRTTELEDGEPGDMLSVVANKLDMYELSDITVHALRFGKFGLSVYVPAVGLGQSSGRVDYRQLIKFGLLDARAIRAATRGRPKLGLTVSDIGKKLIKDLVDLGLIPAPPVL